MNRRAALFFAWVWLACAGAGGQPFQMPTDNHALFEVGQESRFFAPTPGRTWLSGTYGCVRSDGGKFHEGLDILYMHRDRRREPTDPVRSTAAGVVRYVNRIAGHSNYGKYIVVEHEIEGLKIYSLYAHLASIEEGVTGGQRVEAGAPLGIMGRTATIRPPISKDRAHLHFELNLRLTDRFDAWHRKRYKDGRNDHGNWHGHSLVGLDPEIILREQKEQGAAFSLRRFLHRQRDLCRVWIGSTNFFFLRHYPSLVRSNPVAEREGIAGYEVAFNYAGVPFELTPRATSEIPFKERIALMSVNAQEQSEQRCRKMLVWKNRRWQLSSSAQKLLDIMLQ